MIYWVYMELLGSRTVYHLDKKDAGRSINLPGMHSLRFSFIARYLFASYAERSAVVCAV